mmetsp:Transcript_1014/g.1102  ORF Transcript_1014/g.1102 Transcript_1014/m.1102 type:complete len:494 (+) Transcript_1014:388-1869(+)
MIAIGISIVLFFLYFFLFGLDLLGSGAKVMGGCAAGELFGDDTNPVAGVMVGILATVFLQSSSITTSIVVVACIDCLYLFVDIHFDHSSFGRGSRSFVRWLFVFQNKFSSYQFFSFLHSYTTYTVYTNTIQQTTTIQHQQQHQTQMLQKMMLGTSTRVIYKATNINGYLAMLVGLGVTILVQSSSITTSTFTPLVGLGVIRLEQMYPITLGANIGTTVTALLAALLSTTAAMQVALAHLFFNISGIIVWYPVPFMRRVPINAARQLGKATRMWKGIPLVYIFVTFFLIPIILLGLSVLFTQKVKGLTVVGSMLTICVLAAMGYGVYWWKFAGGDQRVMTCMSTRQVKSDTIEHLPENMIEMQKKIKRLEARLGISSGDSDDEDDDDVTLGGKDGKYPTCGANSIYPECGGASKKGNEEGGKDGLYPSCGGDKDEEDFENLISNAWDSVSSRGNKGSKMSTQTGDVASLTASAGNALVDSLQQLTGTTKHSHGD